MMSWPTHVNLNVPEILYSWSNTELEDWTDSFLKQSEAFPFSPLPNLSVTAPNVPLVAEPRSYNNRLQLPPAPVAFGGLSSPTLSSASSAFFDRSTVNGFIDERNQAPTSAGIEIEFSSTILYDPRCPSPWTDVTSSPAPSSNYPNSNTIKSSLNESIPTSTPIQETGGALTPASLYDPGVTSPQMDVTPSSVLAGETSCTSEARKEPSPSKRPCRSRRRTSKKNENKDYGTYKCDYKDCTYGRMFSRKGVLMRHIQTQHINPRGFKCPWCKHASSRRENMKAHRQSVHKEIL